MKYTFIYNGKSYELPKKTIEVAERLEYCAGLDDTDMSIREKFKYFYETIEILTGKENAEEILGSENIEEVDLSEVSIVMQKIMGAYSKPITQSEIRELHDLLNEMPISKLEKLSDLSMGLNK